MGKEGTFGAREFPTRLLLLHILRTGLAANGVISLISLEPTIADDGMDVERWAPPPNGWSRIIFGACKRVGRDLMPVCWFCGSLVSFHTAHPQTRKTQFLAGLIRRYVRQHMLLLNSKSLKRLPTFAFSIHATCKFKSGAKHKANDEAHNVRGGRSMSRVKEEGLECKYERKRGFQQDDLPLVCLPRALVRHSRRGARLDLSSGSGSGSGDVSAHRQRNSRANSRRRYLHIRELRRLQGQVLIHYSGLISRDVFVNGPSSGLLEGEAAGCAQWCPCPPST